MIVDPGQPSLPFRLFISPAHSITCRSTGSRLDGLFEDRHDLEQSFTSLIERSSRLSLIQSPKRVLGSSWQMIDGGAVLRIVVQEPDDAGYQTPL